MSLDPSRFVLVAICTFSNCDIFSFVTRKIVWGLINAWEFGMIWREELKESLPKLLENRQLGKNKAKGTRKGKLDTK